MAHDEDWTWRAHAMRERPKKDSPTVVLGRVRYAQPPGMRVVEVFSATPRDAGGLVAGRTEFFTSRDEAAAYSPCVVALQMATLDGTSGYIIQRVGPDSNPVRAHDSVHALLREQALAKLSPAEREALGLRCAHGRLAGSCLVMGCLHHPGMG